MRSLKESLLVTVVMILVLMILIMGAIGSLIMGAIGIFHAIFG
jgi:hypothetical protein